MKLFLKILALLCLGLTLSGFVYRLSGETENVLQTVRGFLPDDPVIIEAGGYDGTDSVKIAKAWPKGQLFSFEPVPQLFSRIRKKIRSFPNITCFQKALSDRTGHAIFYLSQRGGCVGGSSSLLPPKEHLKVDSSVSFPNVIEVETISLDEWAREHGIDRVDFLWLDMQGYELNMLKASKLASNATAIYMEVEFIEAYEGQYLYEDIKLWMKENRFHLMATNFDEDNIAKEMKERRRYWADALFVRNSAVGQ